MTNEELVTLRKVEALLHEYVGNIPLTDDDWEMEHGVLAELRQMIGMDVFDRYQKVS